MTTAHLDALRATLDAVPGTVSIWYGPVGGPPRYVHAADATHYAASMMKPAVLAALYRAGESGLVDLDAGVPVHNDFGSAADPTIRFGCRRGYDSDDTVWQRYGETAPLRWLANRMIVGSSNLATNIVLGHVGLAAVARVWRIVGARHSIVGRGIEDSTASAAGISNLVTAADIAALLGAIDAGTRPAHPVGTVPGVGAVRAVGAVRVAEEEGGTEEVGTVPGVGAVRLASVVACGAMLDTLLAQEHSEDLAAGLPAGTRVAHKNGWVLGVRHGAGIVYPDDAAPFILAVCTTTPLAVNEQGDAACQLVAEIAAAAWSDRMIPTIMRFGAQKPADHEP